MVKLEVSCPCNPEVITAITDVMQTYSLSADMIEYEPSGYLYLGFINKPDMSINPMLTELRLLNDIYDVRVVKEFPSEVSLYTCRLLLEAIHVPVLLVDRTGHILLANRAISFVCGASIEELIAQPIADYIKGFSLARWFGSDGGRSEERNVYIAGQIYQAKIEPLFEHVVLANLPCALLTFYPDNQILPDLDLATIRGNFAPFGVVGGSQFFAELISELKQIATVPRTVLFYGEQGSGKRFAAQVLNHFRGRSEQITTVIPGSISDETLDSELMEIMVNRPDVVLIDHLEHLTVKQLMRISSQVYCVEQVIFTSRYHPEQLKQNFGADLFYSAIGQTIEILPLRERCEDLMAITEAWLTHESFLRGNNKLQLTKNAQQAIKKQRWEGNIAQLLLVLRDTIAKSGCKAWAASDVQFNALEAKQSVIMNNLFDKNYHDAMADFEKMLLKYHYPHHPSARSLAKHLGLSHTAIARKLKEHKLT